MAAASRCCASCCSASLHAAHAVTRQPCAAVLPAGLLPCRLHTTSHPGSAPRCAAPREGAPSQRQCGLPGGGKGGRARLAAAAAASGASAAGAAGAPPPAATGACDRNGGRTTRARPPPATHTSAPSRSTWAPPRRRQLAAKLPIRPHLCPQSCAAPGHPTPASVRRSTPGQHAGRRPAAQAARAAAARKGAACERGRSEMRLGRRAGGHPAGPPKLAGGPGAGRAGGRRTWAPRERHRRYPSAWGTWFWGRAWGSRLWGGAWRTWAPRKRHRRYPSAWGTWFWGRAWGSRLWGGAWRTWAPRERHRRYPSANGRPSKPSAALVTAPMRAPLSSARPDAKRRAHHHRLILRPSRRRRLHAGQAPPPRSGAGPLPASGGARPRQRRTAHAARHCTPSVSLLRCSAQDRFGGAQKCEGAARSAGCKARIGTVLAAGAADRRRANWYPRAGSIPGRAAWRRGPAGPH